MEAMSVAVLCGGRSRRMGQDKASLAWKGGTMLDMVLRALSGLGNIYLSVNQEKQFAAYSVPVVVDQYPGSGPLGGVCSSLLACQTPLLFVVCCDMPLITSAVGKALLEQMDPGADAVVPRDGSGRIHPLCAVYRREAAPVLVRQLRAGNLRMMDALRCLHTQFVPSQSLPGGTRGLANLNTPEEYRTLLTIS